MYIVMAQVTGLYRTCDCVTSNWAGGGGYLDFSQQFTSNGYGIAITWKSGTALTASVMGLAMFYITVESLRLSGAALDDSWGIHKGNIRDRNRGSITTANCQWWNIPCGRL